MSDCDGQCAEDLPRALASDARLAARVKVLEEAHGAILNYEPREITKDAFAFDRMVSSYRDAARAALAAKEET